MPESIPEWVRKRDGRLVPFEADRISQSLFAATESLGQPNAFLARELTDAILHYLPEEVGSNTPGTEQLQELVIKVVRELGHPQLARHFEEFRQQSPRVVTPPTEPFRPSRAGRPADLTLHLPLDTALPQVLQTVTRQFSLQVIHGRDIVALHHDGLLQIQDLETPDLLAGVVLGNPDSVTAWQDWSARLVALDGPDHWFSPSDPALADLVASLGQGVLRTGVEAIVNLNLATGPAGTSHLARGPLFSDPPAVSPAGREEVSVQLLDQLRGLTAPHAIYWHLCDADFAESAIARLNRPIREVFAGRPLVFVFDRPRRPVLLGPGLTRAHPAVLLGLYLDLALLAEQTNTLGNLELYLNKLGSLGRLALSAGVQKRAYLRRNPRHPLLSEGFLLDRARLRLVPQGLDRLVLENLGRPLESGGASLEMGRKVYQALVEILRQGSKAARLQTCLETDTQLHPEPLAEELPVLWKKHWRIASSLQSTLDMGIVRLPLPPGTPPTAILDLLKILWSQTELLRVRFEKPRPNPIEKLQLPTN